MNVCNLIGDSEILIGGTVNNVFNNFDKILPFVIASDDYFLVRNNEIIKTNIPGSHPALASKPLNLAYQ